MGCYCLNCKHWRQYYIGDIPSFKCVSPRRDLKTNPETGILLCWEANDESSCDSVNIDG